MLSDINFYLFSSVYTCTNSFVKVNKLQIKSDIDQPFILPRSLKLVPGTPGDLVVQSKLSPRSGSVTLRQLIPIYKKGTWSFCITIMPGPLFRANLQCQGKCQAFIAFHDVLYSVVENNWTQGYIQNLMTKRHFLFSQNASF